MQTEYCPLSVYSTFIAGLEAARPYSDFTATSEEIGNYRYLLESA